MPEFIDSILPWNYWITKSMEFSKINTCWTLWYLKKWMVYYNYIIMNPDIYDDIYDKIIGIFNSFIESLPENVQQEATNFFYWVDIREDWEFTKFSDFGHHVTQSNAEEEKKFRISCKKFYFMYLMDIWWQQWYKKKIKEYLDSWKSYVATINYITEEMRGDWMDNDAILAQISDFHAAIRNERQIFFYYGFIYWNENESTGFNRPTLVWEQVVKANFDELLLIWEHQKIKMISQSPVTKIGNLSRAYEDLEIDNFWIAYHPYVILISCLLENTSISNDQYKFLVSRIKNNNLNLWGDVIDNLDNVSLWQVETKVSSFWRGWDTNEEDFQKELKKYILWLRKMPLDNGSNYFTCIRYWNQVIEVEDEARLRFLVRTYSCLTKYLDRKYWEKYSEFESFLKKDYKSRILGLEAPTNWERLDARYSRLKYVISFDSTILLHLIYIWISLKKNSLDFWISEIIFREQYNLYTNLLYFSRIWSRSEFVKSMLNIQWELLNNNYLELLDEEKNTVNYDNINIWQNISEDVLCELSNSALEVSRILNIHESERNVRSSRLRSWMQKYYLANFSDEEWYVKCDCCWETTFKKNDDVPYLEFHHVIPFRTDNGPDHYLNLVWICPTCHRKFHFIKNTEKQNLYSLLSENNNFHRWIEDRIQELYDLNILKPWHLDFLLKESAITNEIYKRFMEMN